ncbi:MAG: response regulator transcription factor [Bacteroidales bacterium]|nr:response regulator transcription factor [Bacteroidales bacterium]
MFNINLLFFLFVYTAIIISLTYIFVQYYLQKKKKKDVEVNGNQVADLTSIQLIGVSDDNPKKEVEHQKVIILETDETLLSTLNSHLAKDYHISSYSLIEDFFNHLENNTPDVIILDGTTCNKTNEVVNQIRQTIQTSHIPIIRLISQQDKRINCKRFADLYIEKPFSVYDLKKGIEGLLLYKKDTSSYYENDKDKEVFEINSYCLHCSNNIEWKFIDEVKRIVEENMSDSDFNIDVLCSILNMSRTSFYNKIKMLTGEAPADYVRSLKLQKATELLSEDRLNINEIAEATGFSDAKYFREVFKKNFNMNPSEYKREIKQ